MINNDCSGKFSLLVVVVMMWLVFSSITSLNLENHQADGLDREDAHRKTNQ